LHIRGGAILAGILALVLVAAACQEEDGGDGGDGGSVGPSESLDPNAPPFVATFSWGEFHLNDRIADKVRSGDTNFNFVMVGYATAAPFFTPIRMGLEQAAQDFGVSTQLIGPSGYTAEEEATALESVIGTDVDGLIVKCPSEDLLVPLINDAIAQGIPLITYNDDCANSNRFAWVGQDLRNAGVVGGEQFLQFFRQAHPEGQGPYEVALMSGAPTAEFARLRFEGFEEVVGQEGDIELIGPFELTFDPAAAFTAVENAFGGHPGLDGMFVADESVLAAGTYADRSDLNGEVTVIGYNLGAGIPELIQGNAIQASIGQYPYDQGYKPVQMLFEFLTKGTMPPCTDCDLGANVISVDNVDAFIGSPEQAKEG
jgi:ABC-type sugar transport system substrate-binding protein